MILEALHEKFYFKSLDLIKEFVDENHPRTFKIINDIAVLYERWGKIRSAEKLLQQQNHRLRLRRKLMRLMSISLLVFRTCSLVVMTKG